MKKLLKSNDAASNRLQSYTSSWANLPQCMVEQIFFKLPLEVVGSSRLRVVCQDWKRLLCSKTFLKRHEVICPSKGPWILSICGSSKVVYVYDDSCKTPRELNAHCALKFLNRLPWLSDGGLICFGDSVWNPLTYSTRRLNCPPGDYHLRLSAFNVDRETDFYRIFFFPKDRSRLHCSFLLIYDSKEDLWCRTRNSPKPFYAEVPGAVFNDSIYFIAWRPDAKAGSEDDVDLQIIFYSLSKNEWGSCVILSSHNDTQSARQLHVWHDRMYVISFSRQARTVSVDEIKTVDADCYTYCYLDQILAGDLENLLSAKSSKFRIIFVSASQNSIMVFINMTTRHESFSQVVLYDLDTRKLSLVEKRFSTLHPAVAGRPGHMLAGFQPRLSIAA